MSETHIVIASTRVKCMVHYIFYFYCNEQKVQLSFFWRAGSRSRRGMHQTVGILPTTMYPNPPQTLNGKWYIMVYALSYCLSASASCPMSLHPTATAKPSRSSSLQSRYVTQWVDFYALRRRRLGLEPLSSSFCNSIFGYHTVGVSWWWSSAQNWDARKSEIQPIRQLSLRRDSPTIGTYVWATKILGWRGDPPTSTNLGGVWACPHLVLVEEVVDWEAG